MVTVGGGVGTGDGSYTKYRQINCPKNSSHMTLPDCEMVRSPFHSEWSEDLELFGNDGMTLGKCEFFYGHKMRIQGIWNWHQR